jgi:hypothetical protein
MAAVRKGASIFPSAGARQLASTGEAAKTPWQELGSAMVSILRPQDSASYDMTISMV